MIKTLQKKFVFTAMTAISVLILLLLGAINVANIIFVGKEIDKTLEIITDMETGIKSQTPKFDPVPHNPPTGMPKNDYDVFMSSNFFVVRFDSQGNIVYTDVSRTSSLSEEEAQNLALQIYNSGNETGKIQRFRYMVRNNYETSGKTAVFLDTSGESFSYFRVLVLSASIGLVCWVLMLVFVILLSRKAIRPIAENIEKQKQFITNAGHEIKTPLAIIQSNTEAMELYNGENKWSRNIKEQTVRLSTLMKHLLTLARMDEGASQINPANFSLTDTLKKIVNSFLQSVEEKKICLWTEIQDDVSLYADRLQIEQLLTILVDNAVKYTDDSGTINVFLEKSDNHVTLKIQNTCTNLPEVSPEKLFDRFYRGDSSRNQKQGGYGIGLAIAKSITEANKGKISAFYIGSDSICFSVTF